MAASYFQALNYTLANEDSALEMHILEPGAKHIMSIAGSGARVLPLLAKGPSVVSCVDVSGAQLLLSQLRFETVRQFDHKQFLSFWGYAQKADHFSHSDDDAQKRQALWQQLQLPKAVSDFGYELFKHHDWQSVLYTGKWEQTFVKLSKLNHYVTGPSAQNIFACKNLAEQIAHYEQEFPRWRFYLCIALLGNATFFNSQLYKGHFPQKNVPQSFFNLYKATFERLFKTGLARENYFLQLLFLGKIVYPEGNPVECQPEVFQKIKSALTHSSNPTQIFYEQGDLTSVVPQMVQKRGQLDFCSLSDVPSYFKGELEKNFLQQLRPHLNNNAVVVIRFYLHISENLDTSGFQDITAKYQNFIEQEKVQVYEVKIYQLKE